MKLPRKGYLIAFEGLDASGKDSQIEKLMKHLQETSIDCIAVYQLETDIGHVIRKKYLSGEVKVDEKVIDLLFAADRLEYLTNKVATYLSQNKIVILNRYLLSALAYGNYKTAMMSYDGKLFTYDNTYSSRIIGMNDVAFRDFYPDLTIFLDIKPETVAKRVAERGEKSEIYEDPRKQIYIRRMFFESMNTFKYDKNKAHVIIDAEKTIEEVADDVWAEFRQNCKYTRFINYKNKEVSNENSST